MVAARDVDAARDPPASRVATRRGTDELRRREAAHEGALIRLCPLGKLGLADPGSALGFGGPGLHRLWRRLLTLGDGESRRLPRGEATVEHAGVNADPAQQVPEPGGEERAGRVVDHDIPVLGDPQGSELVGNHLRFWMRVVVVRVGIHELGGEVDMLRTGDVASQPARTPTVLPVVAIELGGVEHEARVQHGRRVLAVE